MKLYDVPRKSYVKVLDEKIILPIGNEPKQEKNNILFFDHIDSMYSYCKDIDGNIIHLAAWTEVSIVNKLEFIMKYLVRLVMFLVSAIKRIKLWNF